MFDNWICFKFFGQIPCKPINIVICHQVLLKLDKGKVTQNAFVSRI